MADEVQTPESDEEGARRREFLYLATLSVGAVGAAAFAWPLIDSMNPAYSTGSTWSDPDFRTWEGSSGNIHEFDWSG